ncbi:hypothetical protein [Hyphomonas sp.]|uniref:hypothetical protein n=1 Tax=Hyphomonas sp. TaxID=87 RepID=UPI00352769E8
MLLLEIQKKSLELATIIFAQTARAADAGTARFPDFSVELESYYFNEMHAKAVELAVNMRRMDDSGSTSGAWIRLIGEVGAQDPIGSFLAPTTDPMTIRDVCNKIIHADDTRYDQGRIENSDGHGNLLNRQTYLTGEVTLISTDPKNAWKCHIDLLAFARACFTLTDRWVSGDFERSP